MTDISTTDREALTALGRALLADLKRRTPKASGNTAKALRVEDTPTGFAIYGPQYYQALITGRGPTKKGNSGGPTLRQQILEWIKVKGIRFEGMTDEQASWAVSNKIHKTGTKLFRLGLTDGFLDGWPDPKAITTMRQQLAENYSLRVLSDIKTVQKGLA